MSTPANALDITQAGLVKFDGSTVFSGVTTTNHAVLVGAASNGITSLTPGTTNQVLVGNTGSDPSFGAVPAGALPGSGQITLSNGTNITVTGSPVSLGGTATIGVSGTIGVANGGTGISNPTAHNILIGNGSSAMSQLTPSSSSGIPVVSQGVSADPVYGTASVAGGGTGSTTLTNHGVLLGQGTSAVTATAAGSAGQVLQSSGALADPTYSTATYPSTAGTSGKILISDGTNIVNSTPTYPNASVTAGKVIISDGTNYVASTPTFPNASASVGKFIRSDGTNWIASTPTLPVSAGTSGKVLQSNGTNYVESTPTYPSASGTARTMIVSDGTNNVYSTETWAVPGASGNILTSDGTNWTSAAPTSTSAILLTTAVTWSNAALKAGTSLTVLAAQGAGTVIVPVSCVFKFVYGGNNAFTNSPTSQINFSTVNGTRPIFTGPAAGGFWQATSSAYAFLNIQPLTGGFLQTYNNTVSENTAVSATLSIPLTGNASGDNTVKIIMTYFLVSI